MFKFCGRQIEQEDGVVIIDDSIVEKPIHDTVENDLIYWHYDHSQDCNVKGINFVMGLYHTNGYSLPMGFSIVAMTEYYVDKKDGKQKRRSTVSKNWAYCALLMTVKRDEGASEYAHLSRLHPVFR